MVGILRDDDARLIVIINNVICKFRNWEFIWKNIERCNVVLLILTKFTQKKNKMLGNCAPECGLRENKPAGEGENEVTYDEISNSFPPLTIVPRLFAPLPSLTFYSFLLHSKLYHVEAVYLACFFATFAWIFHKKWEKPQLDNITFGVSSWHVQTFCKIVECAKPRCQEIYMREEIRLI